MVKVVSSRIRGIPKNAYLLRINNHSIDDFLEYRFYNDITKIRRILFEYRGKKKEIIIAPSREIEIELETPLYRRCENNCDFCFVNGLPPGLRRELYFKDDDYRLSFLFGNFLSLTNVSRDDIKRIGRLKLSPLYISVHTTNPRLRSRIFQNEKAALIMEQLRALVEQNIKLHTQIVVMPGINDGAVLNRTITRLSGLHPGVNSIGVVPVGRTKYQKKIKSISKIEACRIIEQVNSFHKKFRKKYGKGLVYCSDELYLKAKRRIPDTEYYDDFPQLENGIGMVRKFLNELEDSNERIRLKGNILLLTGRLAYPFLIRLKRKLEVCNLAKNRLDVLSIKNSFFGDSVTVSGLISAADFNRVIKKISRGYRRIILPPNCINEAGRFIDDGKIEDKRVIIAPESVRGLIKCLQS